MMHAHVQLQGVERPKRWYQIKARAECGRLKINPALDVLIGELQLHESDY